MWVARLIVREFRRIPPLVVVDGPERRQQLQRYLQGMPQPDPTAPVSTAPRQRAVRSVWRTGKVPAWVSRQDSRVQVGVRACFCLQLPGGVPSRPAFCCRAKSPCLLSSFLQALCALALRMRNAHLGI